MRSERWPEDWPIRLVQLLAVPGLVIAFYLLLFHNGNLINACTPSGWDDCGQVSGPEAPYAAIGPIPVALIGMVGYTVIFLVTWLAPFWEWLDENLPEIMVALTGIAFIASLTLTALELFVIRAICRYCVISAVIVTIMFVLAIVYIRMLGRSTE